MRKNSQSSGWDDYLGDEHYRSKMQETARIVLLGLWFVVVMVPWIVVVMLLVVTHLSIFRRIDRWLDGVTSKIAGL